jgi:hypothetical protein
MQNWLMTNAELCGLVCVQNGFSVHGFFVMMLDNSDARRSLTEGACFVF